MKYNHLGDSPLSVSRLGLGLAALGRPGYINLNHGNDLNHTYEVPAMKAQTHHMLTEASQMGINYFDVAQSYGKGEEFLSSWLVQHTTNTPPPHVGSKWGYIYTADWKVDAEVHEVKQHTLDVLDKQWASSYERLGTHLRLYQIHSATFESGVLQNVPVLERLASLKAQNILIGLSLSGPQQGAVLQEAMKIEIDKVRLFDCVQATWNLLEPSVGIYLETAANMGMGVIIKEVLANGRLTTRNNEPSFTSKLKILQRAANVSHLSIDALSLAAALQHSWVHIVLSGAVTVQQLRSNLQAVTVDTVDLTKKEREILTENSDTYWKKRNP